MSHSYQHDLISAFLLNQPLENFFKSHLHSPLIRVFKKNEFIFREGELARAVYLLWKGKINLCKKKEGAKENKPETTFYILDTVAEGELLGIVGVLSGMTYSTSAIAAVKVQTIKVLKDDFLQFLAAHPLHQLTIAKKLSRKIIYYESILSGNSKFS
ncbi:cyclic nucleotide-binding domain-containing protein [Catalinimonas sp. 4WD22]|uniref:cyclic nucleotide-binding domain-containing protein n=1 Tax=Catalinimonas locisalis TaxID=3133978 RepID=UPI003101B34A